MRIGHEETRRLLLRDDDPARPAPEETFSDRRTLEIGGERIELAWHGANHTPDNSVIHFPEHDALMMVDIVNVGWVPVYVVNLSDDIPGYLAMPATALTYPWKTLISGHLGRLGTREDVTLHQQYMDGPRGQREDSPSTPSIRRPTSRSTARSGTCGPPSRPTSTRSATRRQPPSSRSTRACSQPRTCSPRTSRSGSMESIRLNRGYGLQVHP